MYTLPETNSSHLKIDGWKTIFVLGRPAFRGYVSFRECNLVGLTCIPLEEYLDVPRHTASPQKNARLQKVVS